MKPKLLKVPTDYTHSFSVRKELHPNINNRWHYHTELELIHFHIGGGMQFIGDHISRFEADDIVLLGSNLPHYWKYDEVHNRTEPDGTTAFSTVIHFNDNFWGNAFLEMPESRELKNVLEKAKKGLTVVKSSAPPIVNLIQKISATKDLRRVIALLDCLLAFADPKNVQSLSSVGFSHSFSDYENERINNIYNFTLNNFNRKILLTEIAALSNLEPNSFCRYFKAKTGKNYSNFLLEIRVGFACKLLLENKLTIKQICFESGFNNFSCFHKGFKLITLKSPKQYQEAYLQH